MLKALCGSSLIVGLTGGAALAQLFVSALGAVLTQQLVVAHQQLHGGELVEAGLDGALLGAGCVTLGKRLERPLVVLMVEVRGLIWRAVCGGGAVPGGEAEVDFGHGGN